MSITANRYMSFPIACETPALVTVAIEHEIFLVGFIMHVYKDIPANGRDAYYCGRPEKNVDEINVQSLHFRWMVLQVSPPSPFSSLPVFLQYPLGWHSLGGMAKIT